MIILNYRFVNSTSRYISTQTDAGAKALAKRMKGIPSYAGLDRPFVRIVDIYASRFASVYVPCEIAKSLSKRRCTSQFRCNNAQVYFVNARKKKKKRTPRPVLRDGVRAIIRQQVARHR